MSEKAVWIAYAEDWSAVVPFPNEKQALRRAVEIKGGVVLTPFGRDPRDVVADLAVK